MEEKRPRGRPKGPSKSKLPVMLEDAVIEWLAEVGKEKGHKTPQSYVAGFLTKSYEKSKVEQ